MKKRVCAIHQPNFFPWFGYFDKIKRSNKFVILDDVQFQKTGGTWMNRVAININGEKKWLTAPIVRPSGLWKVNETKFHHSEWRDKIKKTIQINYAKCKYFKLHKNFIFELIDFSSNKLVDYNVNAISKICEFIGIDFKNKAIFSSSLNLSSSSTQRLIDITNAVGCNIYMAGGGADGYMDINLFKKYNIMQIYQNFMHPVYEQYNTKNFISELSIIDYIFNVGLSQGNNFKKYQEVD